MLPTHFLELAKCMLTIEYPTAKAHSACAGEGVQQANLILLADCVPASGCLGFWECGVGLYPAYCSSGKEHGQMEVQIVSSSLQMA